MSAAVNCGEAPFSDAVRTLVEGNAAGFSLARFVVAEIQAAADDAEPVGDGAMAGWAAQLRFLLERLEDLNDAMEAALPPAAGGAA